MTLAEARKQGRVRRQMNMIFQDPYASLNPRWRVTDIIAEPIRTFGLEKDRGPRCDGGWRWLLTQVGLAPSDGEKVPARILRRTAATRLHRAGAVVRAGVSGVRRTDQRAGRFGAGANSEFDARSATAAWADILVHQPQPRRGAAHVGPVGRDVSRPHRRTRPMPKRFSGGRCIRIRGCCWMPFRIWIISAGRERRSAAMCRARSRHHPAARFIRAVPWRTRAAGRRCRRLSMWMAFRSPVTRSARGGPEVSRIATATRFNHRANSTKD